MPFKTDIYLWKQVFLDRTGVSEGSLQVIDIAMILENACVSTFY